MDLNYELYDNRRQFNIMNLAQDSYGYLSIKVNSSGLSHDLPFGSPSHIFAIKATNSHGVSSYAPVRIQVIGKNNKAPIPMVNDRFSLFFIIFPNKFRSIIV